MSTKPTHDTESIVLDGRRIHDAALAAAKTNHAFSRRLQPHELAAFDANLRALEAGAGARTATLADKVAAGVHVAEARASVMSFARDVAEDAHIEFPNDATLQHAFGVGLSTSPASTSEVRDRGDSLLAAAAAHPKEAAKLGLDHHGVHDLEAMLHALEGADLAHVHAATKRHTLTTHTDSLAHVVSSETARLRRIARRVLKSDADALAAFAHTLPRHAITPRTHVTAPPAAAATG